MVTKSGIASSYLQLKSERRFNIMMNNGFDREVRFEILEHIGIISTHPTGWNKELNIVSWNGGQPKYDIRDWDLDHEHMSRGVTLHEKEMRQIFDLMKRRRMGNRFRREDPQPAPQQQMAPPEMDDGFVQSTVPDEPFDATASQMMADGESVPEEILVEPIPEAQQQEQAAF